MFCVRTMGTVMCGHVCMCFELCLMGTVCVRVCVCVCVCVCGFPATDMTCSNCILVDTNTNANQVRFGLACM